MEIAAVMHLSEISAPAGVTFLDDPDETIIATITVPSQVIEPEIEEETELVGEEAAAAEEPEGDAPRRRRRSRRCRRGRRRRILSLFRRRRDGEGGRVDWLVVGLGNPGDSYKGTRHNLGFEVANTLATRWELPRAKKKYAGLYSEGRAGVGGPRVAMLLPQTYMNDAGKSVGPARGALGVPLDRVLVVHDEIDLPFGRVESRVGGGLAGHNGLKAVKQGLGSADFRRIRAGVGRPDSTDPEIVSAYVLGKFREPARRGAGSGGSSGGRGGEFAIPRRRMNITLGNELTVNRLGFGAMRITGEGIWGEPRRPRRGARACCAAPSSSA